MDIKNKTVLVLGAWGLVGNAVTRKIIAEKPKKMVITSLKENEIKNEIEKLTKEFPELPEDYFVPWWGNIFVRDEFKDENRIELLSDQAKRDILMKDTLEELTPAILSESSLFKLIDEHKPEIVIDCINSATGIAYQDIYTSYREIKKTIATDKSRDAIVEQTEKLLCTLYIPQLIRHIQILYAAMNKADSEIYMKIGTSGTGGMGLNIPYTHSEEKPSRVLLSKSSVAGAHSLLLFLMGRTPDAPITKEIKPTAAIAWKKIQFGKIKKRGHGIELVDLPLSAAIPLNEKLTLDLETKFETTGKELESVYIDTGENGTFSRGEFEAITSQGQMEYVTPEEIAADVIYEIKGGNTGHDIINALDNATLEPTYRAGFLQHYAIEELKELEDLHGKNSVAFELLGPPRLSKLLFEIHLLKLVAKTLKGITQISPEKLSEEIFNIISSDDELRGEIISIGIPILMPDGKSLLRGNVMKIPPFRGENELPVNEHNINLWAKDGWVDLRIKNMVKWQSRINMIIDTTEKIREDDTSSMYVRNKRYWNYFEQIDIGKVVGWIFIVEEEGMRMKA